MTEKEKSAILGALELMTKAIEAEVPGSPIDSLPGTIPMPEIGPMFDSVKIFNRMTALPFTDMEVRQVVRDIDHAIKRETRMGGIADQTSQVLSLLRPLIPMILAL